MKQIPYIKMLAFPIIGIAVIAVLSLTMGSFLMGKINELIAQHNLDTTQEAQLQKKLTSLQEIDPAVLSKSDAAYIAIPDKNPSVFAVAQLRRFAAEAEVALTKLNITATNTQGQELSRSTVQFTVEGDYSKVVSFLDRMKNSSPLLSLDRVKITQTILNTTEATAILNAFWAPFPETLPSVTEAVTNLSVEEIELLDQLSSLEQPQFNALPAESSGAARPNPFSIE